ncbi:hypothetical protein AUJ66_01535 [Candidatus Desantisbacteria bacterium CG1_02_38_46]|uniref:Restriction endonuclease type IV Mrr domain-containing protein n=3 Tax=unclassified Candidatus Desantisiibacteriota TaxID=3106372 RepID=A0A2H9PAV3_9BACT|nr:MAG: hypothetical protein AUJ66_01535 [Candidatus Desantisbacteria bacterium CG1_02_38_46]PIU51162.1 MAG: hypothetical protein COS91_05890 [Candidatus Desantisbacteria bacterium CG07_land_8_20_14_0_80_39_15]PIZ14759.1 MAG: hypothetical protein COY51_07370 [Candidatus Desantisbacteria bacterium CG_4_10_14_0_8_um_filter_39_17]
MIKINREKSNLGKEHELIIMNVYTGLLKKYPGAKVEFRKKIMGKSNTLKEIDVYTEIPIGPHTYKTAIEYKDYKNNIGIEKVQEFLGKLQDINIDKGILVTKSGYTEPAEKFAKEHGIDLIELRKPKEEDWEGRAKTIHVQMQIYYPEIFDIELKTDRRELVGKKMSGLANELIFVDENGNIYKNFNKIIQENIQNDLTEEIKTVNITFKKPYFFKIDSEKVSVKGMSFKYRFQKVPKEIIIDGENIVELIIKDTFTGEIKTIDKNFTISEKK